MDNSFEHAHGASETRANHPNLASGNVVFDATKQTVTFTPSAGYVGAAAFDYTISDGHGGLATGTVGVTVKAGATGAGFLAYLVWTWHWAEPGDSRVPWNRARQLRLSPVDQTRKRWAIKSFRSQIEPLSDEAGDEAILSPEMLAHFARPFEVFLA